MTRTVFVVGARASKEARLPVGSELRALIASAVEIRYERGRQKGGSIEIGDVIQTCVPNPKECLNAAAKIRSAMPLAISIDNFLDAHNEDKSIELVGKLAIVRTILQAERDSILWPVSTRPDRLDFQVLSSTWYNRFWQLLTENCRLSGLEQRLQRVALVVFNYDRCIETFLLHAIQTYYHVSHEHAVSLLGKLQIFHPYGSIGQLAFDAEEGVPFGADLQGDRLLSAALRIKTFTEGTDEDSSEISLIRLLVAGASTLVFLGFAYHRLNVQLILPTPSGNKMDNNNLIIGTAKGLSQTDVETIRADLYWRTGSRRIALNKAQNCSDLFDEYFRSLALP